MSKLIQLDEWYVDIGGAVSGPMSTRVVIDGLMVGDIKVTHRVSRDRTGWKAICNEPHFETAMTDLLRSMTERATRLKPQGEVRAEVKEESGFHNLQQIRENISQQLEHAKQLTEINVNLNSLRRLLASMAQNRKVVVERKVKPVVEVHADDRDVILVDPKETQAMRADSVRFLFRIFLLVAILFSAYVANDVRLDHQRRAELEAIETQKKEAVRAKIMGDYEKALSLFKEINTDATFDANTLLEMAEAAMQTKRNDEAGALCQRALTASATGEQKARARSLLGLIALQAKDSAGAEVQFREGLKEQDHFSALHNLGILFLDRRQPKLAEPLLLKALPLSGKDQGATLLALFETAIEMDRLDPVLVQDETGIDRPPVNGYDRLKRVERLFGEHQSRSDLYHEEILVAQTLAALTRGQTEELGKRMRLLLDRHPKTAVAKDLRMDLDYLRAGWRHILSWCSTLYKSNPNDAVAMAFMANCAQRSAGAKAALPYAQAAFGKQPNDPQIRGTWAQTLFAAGRIDEAKQVLAALEPEGLKKSQISVQTMIEICTQSGDQSCLSKFDARLPAAQATDRK